MGAASAIVGFALGGWLTAEGALRLVYDRLAAPRFTARWSSLPDVLGVGRWGVVGALVVGMALILWGVRRLPDPEGIWRWWRNGLAVGAIGVAAWLAAAPAGWGYGLSMTGPTRDLMAWAIGSQAAPVTWGTGLILGIPLGSYVSRRLAGIFRWAPAPPRMLVRRFAGGVLMGVGGTLAAGCNIGNGLTGFSILAAQSVVAIACIALGRWAVDAAGAAWATGILRPAREQAAPLTPTSNE